MSSSTRTTNTYSKSDYLQPTFSSSSSSLSSSSTSVSDLTSVAHLWFNRISLSLFFQYDASQSPLALLAQTCSSIGKDSPSPPAVSTPPIITSLVSKTTTTTTSSPSQEKSFPSTKRSLPSHVNRKSTLPLKPSPVGKSSSSSSLLESSHFPTLFDPTAASLLLRSSLAYLAAQQQQQQQQHSYSSACPIPGCLQCETVRHILAASTVNNHAYASHGRYNPSNDDLFDYVQQSSRAVKSSPTPPPPSASHRFHPYLKPTATTTSTMTMINNNDQLPFFYPHLSLSPMTGSTRRMNNNPNNTN